MEGYFRFTDHWASFVESYAQAVARESGVLSLPEISREKGDGGGVVVHVPAAYENLALLYGGQQYGKQPETGTSLSVGELLAMLPWQHRAHGSGAPWQGGLPERALIRLCAQDQEHFVQRAAELREAVFALNGRGVRDVTISSAFPIETPDGTRYEVLLFVAHLHSGSLAQWLQDQATTSDPQARISVYQPYELAPSAEHDQQPYGAWLPLSLSGRPASQMTKPFLSVLAHEARRGNQLWLLEPTNRGESSQVRRIAAPFLPLYYFSRFKVAPPAQVISWGEPNRARGDVRRPFVIGLELRQDGERVPEHERMRRALEMARSRIVQRQKELEREDRRIRHLVRLIEAEDIGMTRIDRLSNVDAISRRPRKRLYLFFEHHSDDHTAGERWPAFQELLLNASLAELRNLRYAYCRFSFASLDGSSHCTTFHLVGCGISSGSESAPDSPPPDLQSADQVFEQDADWRRIGYNLYLPEGLMLYPPLRPWSPGQRVASADGDGGSSAEADSWPGPLHERLLFDDLLAQAVFVPEGTQAAEAALTRVDEFWDAGTGRDNLCLIYEDRPTGCVIPIFLRATDFVPLSEAVVGHLNQSGLLAGPTVTADPKGPIVGVARQTDLLLEEAFQQQADSHSLGDAVDAMAKDLQGQMVQLLKNSLGERVAEINKERERRLGEYQNETDALAAELEAVQRDWRQTKQNLGDAVRDLRTKTRAAERLFGDLRKSRAGVEELAQRGIHKWEEFIAKTLETTQGLQVQADEVCSEAGAQVEKATAELRSAQSEITGDVVERLRSMQAKLLEIGAQTGEKTAALQRVINYLTEAQAALGHPPQIPEQREQATAVDMISVMNDLSAARAEAGTLRAQLEQQQADAETQLQEMKAALSETERQMARSMEDLGQRATQAEARERQLKSETSQSAVQIQMLKDQVGSLQQQIQTIQSESSAVADDLKRRLVEAIDELRRFQADLEMAQGQLREGDQLGRDVAFEPTRRRFLALAEIIDDLRRAESSEPAMEAYNRGLRHIRERFYTYFREQFRVSVAEIQPGSTEFDYHAGQRAVGVEWVPSLPEGAVLRVVSDGYLFQGKHLREAQVIVNQRPPEVSS